MTFISSGLAMPGGFDTRYAAQQDVGPIHSSFM
jgi:hypothetical protein